MKLLETAIRTQIGDIMLGFIKIFEKDVALRLKAEGFNYLKEKINNQDVYSFEATAEMVKVLNSLYSPAEYFKDDILRFGGELCAK